MRDVLAVPDILRESAGGSGPARILSGTAALVPMDDLVRDIVARIEKLGRINQREEKQRWALVKQLQKCSPEQLTELAQKLKHHTVEVDHPLHIAETFETYAAIVRGKLKPPKAHKRKI